MLYLKALKIYYKRLCVEACLLLVRHIKSVWESFGDIWGASLDIFLDLLVLVLLFLFSVGAFLVGFFVVMFPAGREAFKDE